MSDRLKRYIDKQKKQGKKRVSFFIDEKLWKYLTKRAKAEKLQMSDYLKKCFHFN
jgi:hypothetical protein